MLSSKKLKYVCQGNSYGCGPTLLKNVRIWSSGVSLSNKQLIELCGGKERVKESGTNIDVVNVLLGSICGVDIQKVSHGAKLREINKHLDSGGIVALAHLLKEEDCGHYCLILSRTKNRYVIVNAYENRVFSRITPQSLQKTLNLDRWSLGCYNCSVVWFLTKQ